MNKKQKNSVLWITFLLLLWVIYKVPIHKTIETKQMCAKLQQEQNLLENASQKIEYLQQKSTHLDRLLQQNDFSINSSFQQILLKKITAFSEKENIAILVFNEPHSIQNNQTIQETYFFEVKGNFTAILKLINQLEQQQLGKIISVNFTKKKNYRKNNSYLTAQIYLQRLG